MEQVGQIEERDDLKAREDFAAARASVRQRLILIVAVQPVKMLDIVALLDAFSEANRVTHGDPEYEVRVVSGGPDRTLKNQDGVAMQAAMVYNECFDMPDTLLVAGADDDGAPLHDEQFLKWLRWQASQSRRIGTVSSGALLLAEAGLLNDKRATTHWQIHDVLSTRYPRVSVERDVLYVRDANLYTCAGATACLDLALSMIDEDLGSKMATEVAQSMLVYLRRSGGAPQISAALRAQATPANPVTDLLTWLPDNLRQNLSIKSLARRSAMSPRNFARIFARQVGLTPAKHIENLRLQAAQFQLESSTLTIEEIAFAAGLQNGETLRRLFIRRLGVTPGRYRAMKAPLVAKGADALQFSNRTGARTRVRNQ